MSPPINSMSIVLFKFPILVIAEIIKSMGLRDIFISSLASKRTRNVIKGSMTRARCSVVVGLDDTLFSCELKDFYITGEQEPENHETVRYKIGPSYYNLVILPNDIINIYWTQPSDKTNCVKHMMTYISETFNKPTASWFSVDCRGTGEPELDIIRHSKSAFRSVEQMRYANFGVSPEVFIQTFEEFRHFKCLFQETLLPDDFEYSPSSPDYFQMDHVHFRNGIHWVILDDYMECKDIGMSEDTTRYHTPAILNAFIRKWIDADCRLETLEVWFPNDDIDFEAVANGLGRIRDDFDEKFVEFKGANGKKARISTEGRKFRMEVRK